MKASKMYSRIKSNVSTRTLGHDDLTKFIAERCFGGTNTKVNTWNRLGMMLVKGVAVMHYIAIVLT